LLLGCPNPQTYGVPRTTPSGKIQHTVALEGFHAAANNSTVVANPSGGTTTRNQTESLTLPLLPTYQLRVGVADRVDIGARVTNLSALGGDVKWNFMKSESVDLAINPGLQFNYFSAGGSSIFFFYGHLPLMVGFNFGESATLIGTGGLVFAYGSATAADGDRATTSTGSGGTVGARFGLGMQFRVSKKFALHPEITAMKFFENNELLWITFGLGFNFGNLPAYHPGSENDEPDPNDPKNQKKTDPPTAAPAGGQPAVTVPPPAAGT